MIRHILMPIKDLRADARTLAWTRQAFPHADVTLFHVLAPCGRTPTPLPMMAYGSVQSVICTAADERKRTAHTLTHLALMARRHGSGRTHAEVVVAEQVGREILRRAAGGTFDLIVLGRAARREKPRWPWRLVNLEHLRTGSVTRQVYGDALIPVLTVPEGEPAGGGGSTAQSQEARRPDLSPQRHPL